MGNLINLSSTQIRIPVTYYNPIMKTLGYSTLLDFRQVGEECCVYIVSVNNRGTLQNRGKAGPVVPHMTSRQHAGCASVVLL